MIKKLGILLALSMLIISTFAQTVSFANSNDASMNNDSVLVSSNYVEMIEQAQIFSEENGEVGQVNVGSVLTVKEKRDGKVFFQWGQELAYVELEKTKDTLLTEESLLTPYDELKSNEGYFKSSEDVEVQLLDTNLEVESGDFFFTIQSDILYPVVEKKDGFLKIAIGGFYYYLLDDQSRFSYVATDNISDPTNEEPTTDPTNEEPSDVDEEPVVEEDPVDGEEPTVDDENKEETNPSSTKDNTPSESSDEDMSNVAEDESVTTENNKEETDPQITTKTTASAQFTSSIKYFEVTGATAIYIKKDGDLIRSGRLSEGETYPRIRDYGANWHEIKFGNSVAYVMKDYTKPGSSSNINNLNGPYNNSSKTIRPLINVAVYDNTSGKLVPFAGLYTNIDYPIVGDYGSWYRVIVAGRVGFVKKSLVSTSFTSTDKYFKVLETTAIYANENGKLVRVGRVPEGEVYPRIRDFGNWHEVKFGNGTGYVAKEFTTPSDGTSLKNINSGYSNTTRFFIPKENVAVYDNSSGKLISFAGINEGVKYPIVGDYGSWFRVIYSDRVGYVRKSDVNVAFNTSDKYFEATEDSAIYILEGSKLVSVGAVYKGQVYPRIRDYGNNWHEVKFGNTVGYVKKDLTIPYIGSIGDLNNTQNSSNSFYLSQNIAVYAKNSSGDLIQYSALYANYRYPILSDYGSWYMVDVLGRVGYVRKSDVQTGQAVTTEALPVYNTWEELSDWEIHLSTDYTHKDVLTYGDFVNILEQYSYGAKIMFNTNEIGWVQNSYLLDNPLDADYLLVEDRNIRTDRLVNDSTLIGLVKGGTKVKVLEYQYNGKDSYKHWYKIRTSDGKVGWITGYSSSRGKLLVRIEDASSTFSIFTDLRTQQQNVTAEAIDAFIKSKKSDSVLIGMGKTYVEAAEQSGVNIIYLLAHSILETGWGTSSLVKDKNNFFGIRAFDSCAYSCASSWDTKEEGLIQGSIWIANNYIYDGYKQYTVDHMRNNLQVHQYATDEAWHQKIANLGREFIAFQNNNK
ncbi:glucosaminidase domain-containing protein [Metabacillus bambusae]|uniref:Glucosaminidase domain-containing protein n=1 Tax=Metabacillus bambusae TaxID=2795218 RepID=A0ABS3N0G3_9BACI|nr:glucosaminidase domain-containing protein [Metabacillus bambusae]MBO1511762.1 glucosaminidase domain-containing protein [Metabacillus bambusae]